MSFNNCEFCDIIEVFGRHPRSTEVPAQLTAGEARRPCVPPASAGACLLSDDERGGQQGETLAASCAVRKSGRGMQTFPRFRCPRAQHQPGRLGNELDQRMVVYAGFDSVFVGIETPSTRGPCAKLTRRRISRVDALSRAKGGHGRLSGRVHRGSIQTDASAYRAPARVDREIVHPPIHGGILGALSGNPIGRRLIRRGPAWLERSSGATFGRTNSAPRWTK